MGAFGAVLGEKWWRRRRYSLEPSCVLELDRTGFYCILYPLAGEREKRLRRRRQKRHDLLESERLDSQDPTRMRMARRKPVQQNAMDPMHCSHRQRT